MYSGEGTGQSNTDLLVAVVSMVKVSGLPAVVVGDFQKHESGNV